MQSRSNLWSAAKNSYSTTFSTITQAENVQYGYFLLHIGCTTIACWFSKLQTHLLRFFTVSIKWKILSTNACLSLQSPILMEYGNQNDKTSTQQCQIWPWNTTSSKSYASFIMSFDTPESTKVEQLQITIGKQIFFSSWLQQ